MKLFWFLKPVLVLSCLAFCFGPPTYAADSQDDGPPQFFVVDLPGYDSDIFDPGVVKAQMLAAVKAGIQTAATGIQAEGNADLDGDEASLFFSRISAEITRALAKNAGAMTRQFTYYGRESVKVAVVQVFGDSPYLKEIYSAQFNSGMGSLVPEGKTQHFAQMINKHIAHVRDTAEGNSARPQAVHIEVEFKPSGTHVIHVTSLVDVMEVNETLETRRGLIHIDSANAGSKEQQLSAMAKMDIEFTSGARPELPAKVSLSSLTVEMGAFDAVDVDKVAEGQLAWNFSTPSWARRAIDRGVAPRFGFRLASPAPDKQGWFDRFFLNLLKFPFRGSATVDSVTFKHGQLEGLRGRFSFLPGLRYLAYVPFALGDTFKLARRLGWKGSLPGFIQAQLAGPGKIIADEFYKLLGGDEIVPRSPMVEAQPQVRNSDASSHYIANMKPAEASLANMVSQDKRQGLYDLVQQRMDESQRFSRTEGLRSAQQFVAGLDSYRAEAVRGTGTPSTLENNEFTRLSLPQMIHEVGIQIRQAYQTQNGSLQASDVLMALGYGQAFKPTLWQRVRYTEWDMFKLDAAIGLANSDPSSLSGQEFELAYEDLKRKQRVLLLGKDDGSYKYEDLRQQVIKHAVSLQRQSFRIRKTIQELVREVIVSEGLDQFLSVADVENGLREVQLKGASEEFMKMMRRLRPLMTWLRSFERTIGNRATLYAYKDSASPSESLSNKELIAYKAEILSNSAQSKPFAEAIMKSDLAPLYFVTADQPTFDRVSKDYKGRGRVYTTIGLSSVAAVIARFAGDSDSHTFGMVPVVDPESGETTYQVLNASFDGVLIKPFEKVVGTSATVAVFQFRDLGKGDDWGNSLRDKFHELKPEYNFAFDFQDLTKWMCSGSVYNGGVFACNPFNMYPVRRDFSEAPKQVSLDFAGRFIQETVAPSDTFYSSSLRIDGEWSDQTRSHEINLYIAVADLVLQFLKQHEFGYEIIESPKLTSAIEGMLHLRDRARGMSEDDFVRGLSKEIQDLPIFAKLGFDIQSKEQKVKDLTKKIHAVMGEKMPAGLEVGAINSILYIDLVLTRLFEDVREYQYQFMRERGVPLDYNQMANASFIIFDDLVQKGTFPFLRKFSPQGSYCRQIFQ